MANSSLGPGQTTETGITQRTEIGINDPAVAQNTALRNRQKLNDLTESAGYSHTSKNAEPIEKTKSRPQTGYLSGPSARALEAVASTQPRLNIFPFLSLLAVDAKLGPRNRFQPLSPDFPLAIAALAISAILNTKEGIRDILQKTSFSIAETEHKFFHVGTGSFIGEVHRLALAMDRSTVAFGLLDLLDQLVALLLQPFTKVLQQLVIQHGRPSLLLIGQFLVEGEHPLDLVHQKRSEPVHGEISTWVSGFYLLLQKHPDKSQRH